MALRGRERGLHRIYRAPYILLGCGLVVLRTQQVAHAWTSSGNSNDELISNLIRDGIVKSNAVEAAMRQVDRAHFVRDGTDAYRDAPARISAEATISAPHMHGHALERLQVTVCC